jgi:Sugar kinases, ribokinase family
MMVTRVGDDTFADATIANFQRNGIDATHVLRTPGRSSGVAPIFVEPSGENSILIVKGANADLTAADVDAAAPALKDCKLILMQMEVPVETVYHTVRLAKDLGVPTLLNPAPAAADLDVARLADLAFLTPNETELATLTGLPVGNEDEAEAAARTLIARGIGTVVVTMGWPRRPAGRCQWHAPDRPGQGGAGGHHRGRRRLHRLVRPLLHRRAAGVSGADGSGEYAADSITRRGTQRSYATLAEFRARFS